MPLSKQAEATAQADFALQFNYDKNTTDASRIFKSIQETLSAFEAIDRIFVPCIDGKIEPILMLESVEQGSIKLWLRQALTTLNDQALKHLDWKLQVGIYLVKTKYLMISFLEKYPKSQEDKLAEGLKALGSNIKKEAEKTAALHIPAYQEPSQKDLLMAIRRMQEASTLLTPNEKFTYITEDEAPKSWGAIPVAPESFEALLTGNTIKNRDVKMLLLVRKPDYLGETQWEFKYDTRVIRATILDTKWLQQFQGRKVSVRPGDSLDCVVEIKTDYDNDGVVLRETYTITKVNQIRPKAPLPTQLDIT